MPRTSNAVSHLMLCLLSCGALALLAPRAARGQAPRPKAEETREYDVFVKGKPSGKTAIRITQTDKAATTVSTEASIQFNFLFVRYRYEFHGQEVWRDGGLVRVDNRANDDGKPLTARAVVDAHGSTIEAQGKPAQRGPVLAMTTNYWRLPDAQTAAGEFSIMEGDTGVVKKVRLHRIGPEKIVVGEHQVACTHYRVSGGFAAELWFDEQDRLVRQQTVEEGYLTELRLTQIRNGAPLAPAAPR